MEWSKNKTLKLIELLQVNASLWNPSLCDTRRDKQKRREELRNLSRMLGISVPDATKKIQHLRTQYNRESAKEARANSEDPNNGFVSNWYAYEYLHFLKDSSKPCRVLKSDELEIDYILPQPSDNTIDCKLGSVPPHKIARKDSTNSVKADILSTTVKNRDEFSVFGEYVANELRSLKGEKNLLVAKKKIQDAIFEVKMGLIEPITETVCVYTHKNSVQHNTSPLQNGKIVYTTPLMSSSTHIEPMNTAHTPPTSGMSEIIINNACHYSNFKVDTQ